MASCENVSGLGNFMTRLGKKEIDCETKIQIVGKEEES